MKILKRALSTLVTAVLVVSIISVSVTAGPGLSIIYDGGVSVLRYDADNCFNRLYLYGGLNSLGCFTTWGTQSGAGWKEESSGGYDNRQPPETSHTALVFTET